MRGGVCACPRVPTTPLYLPTNQPINHPPARLQEIGVDMLPQIAPIEESTVTLRALTEGVHSREAIDMVKVRWGWLERLLLCAPAVCSTCR